MVQDRIESKAFERFIVVCILLNALTLGLETNLSWDSSVRAALHLVDRLFLGIFATELLLKLFVYRWSYFRDPWRVFDFLVVSLSLFPSSGAFSVVRSLRVLRTLRMISVVPSLRKVVSGLLAAVPGLGAVSAIMAIVFYAGAVMATKLFGAQFPDWFGSIWLSMYTLFQVMTLESWSMGIVRPVLEVFPYAWIFFLPFILLTTFTMLNLFIAVIVNALNVETDEAAAERETRGHDERIELLAEVRRMRSQLDRIHRHLERRN
jgi:voltage-gated sodium channel